MLAAPLLALACAKTSTPKGPEPTKPGPSASSSVAWTAPRPSASIAKPNRSALPRIQGFGDEGPDERARPEPPVAFGALSPACIPNALGVDEKAVYVLCSQTSLVRVEKATGAMKEIHKSTEAMGSLGVGRGRLFFGSQNFNPDPKLGTVSSMPSDGGPVLILDGRFLGPNRIFPLEKGVLVEDQERVAYVPASGGAVVTLFRASPGARVWGGRGSDLVWTTEHPPAGQAPEEGDDARGHLVVTMKVPHGAKREIALAELPPMGVVVDDKAAFVVGTSGEVTRVPLEGGAPKALGVAAGAAPLAIHEQGDFLYWWTTSPSGEGQVLFRLAKAGGRKREAIVAASDSQGWMDIAVDDTHVWIARPGALLRAPKR